MSCELSDLRDRLPLFEDYRNAIGDPSGRAYEYIDPTVVSMMTNCVPVGLRSDNTLAIPKSYEPEDGPPILMLRLGEQVNVRWSRGMEKAAQHVLKLSNTVCLVDLDTVVTPSSSNFGFINSIGLKLTNSRTPTAAMEPLVIPMYIGLRPLALPVDRAPVLLHEFDHWDFRLNTAPLFSLPGTSALPDDGSAVLSEKRAYMTQYAHITNTGLSHYFMTAEELAHSIQGHSPIDAAKVAWDLYWQNYQSGPQSSHAATVAMALSLRFGSTDETAPTTQQEIEAYRAANLISAP